MSVSGAQPTESLDIQPPAQFGRLLSSKYAVPLIVVGAIWSAAALFTDIERGSFAYLLGFSFIWSIALGCLFLLTLHHITHAVWSVVFKRILEMFVSALPIIGLAFIPVLFLAPYIFEWLHPEDEIIQGKAPYLNLPFFILRAVVYFALWIWFGYFKFVKMSLSQDEGGAGAEASLKMRGLSAPFMLIFALTATFASFDWWMSLAPHWFSTIFGVYAFSGMTISALCCVTLTVICLKRLNLIDKSLITRDHMYNLGALLFAFSCFWGYIAMSQYLLIWYGNLPEETFWYVLRWKNGWVGMTLLLMFLRFVLPFFALLSRKAKMNETTLLWVSILLLAGHFVDLHWLIMPQVRENAVALSWHDFGPLLLMVGILLWTLADFLKKHRPVAVGDPLLENSRHFHL